MASTPDEATVLPPRLTICPLTPMSSVASSRPEPRSVPGGRGLSAAVRVYQAVGQRRYRRNDVEEVVAEQALHRQSSRHRVAASTNRLFSSTSPAAFSTRNVSLAFVPEVDQHIRAARAVGRQAPGPRRGSGRRSASSPLTANAPDWSVEPGVCVMTSAPPVPTTVKLSLSASPS